MKPELTLIPTVIIHPSQITVFKEVLWNPTKHKSNVDVKTLRFDTDKNESFLKSERKAKGNVSVQANRKISKAVDYLITTSTEKKVRERITGKTIKFKVAFVTLTLPSKQIHPDSIIINKCLNSLILELKKYYNVKNYVWRAEKQKNHNLHFHLICDKFIPWSELRDRWNRIINKLGYVSRYQEFLKEWHNSGFKVRKDLLKNWDEQSQRLAWQKGKTNDFSNPNSTDIHSTKKILNIKKYLTKYLTKNETPQIDENDPEFDIKNQSGRLWGCNHELSNIQGFKSEMDWEISEELDRVVKNFHIIPYRSTYFTTFNIDYRMLKMLGADHLFKYFCDYLFDKFGFSEQLKIA